MGALKMLFSHATSLQLLTQLSHVDDPALFNALYDNESSAGIENILTEDVGLSFLGVDDKFVGDHYCLGFYGSCWALFCSSTPYDTLQFL